MHWRDALLLKKKNRRAGSEILRGYAEEEAAKFLILVDSVRCPKSPGDQFSRQLRYCGDHVAKGIYVNLYQNPTQVKFSKVRQLVASMRKNSYVDGPWTFRNDILTLREERAYVDYVYDDYLHEWWDPMTHSRLFGRFRWFGMPRVLRVACSLRRSGFTSPASLKLVARIWRKESIGDDLGPQDQRELNEKTLREMRGKELLRRASTAVYKTVVDSWLLPLYPLDLGMEKANPEG